MMLRTKARHLFLSVAQIGQSCKYTGRTRQKREGMLELQYRKQQEGETNMLINGSSQELEALFREKKVQSVLLVCGNSFRRQSIYGRIKEAVRAAGAELTEFSDFAPNPKYESTVKGVQVFLENQCDFIIAAGGGSAMDVAKCIKLFWNMDSRRNYLEQEIVENEVPLLAIPTTAGTGSEETKSAVIYYEGEKQSVGHPSGKPEYVILDAEPLKTLPEYQKKATMLDAFCHCIEASWSVKSTEESREYAAEAIRQILKYKESYLKNEQAGNEGMLRAASLAGRAINISQTTAGHAMCYKLTSLYGLAHGHSAAFCVSVLWPHITEHLENCNDPEGEEHFRGILEGIARAMGCDTVEASIEKYQKLLDELELPVPVLREEQELEILKKSVNPDRLKNHPVQLDEEAIERLYREIFKKA